MRKQSISVHFARAVLRHTVRLGVDPLPLLRHHRITPRLLREPHARIAIERFADLQVATMQALGDEALGYGQRPIPLGSWDMMCHAVIGSATLGQALARLCRFYALFGHDPASAFEVSGDQAAVRLREQGTTAVDPYLKELFLFNVHRFGSWLVQEHLPLYRTRLDYPPAAQPDDYRRMFLASPVDFEAGRCALEFPAGLMDRPVVQNEATLRRFLRHPVLIMLTQQYPRATWTAQVRDLVRQNLLAMPELGEVAAALEVHPQTLRRRLAREGTTFKDIKNQLRRDVALHYLGRRGLSIEEIAHRAGFSESSAFIRAFKGWTGVTPYAYRKGL
ncbi:AraC family transcriptional regulator [Pseudohaliea rubra]|uniref:Putative transcriptional regulator n=1 Tax=Pseudohaliea rubra DSM 19751 TaxID=1265313 RepID=A0A095X1Y4_9GAMM|nr:AraC family transcriptional regulator [Pseudohaliea rubra]KGE04894.1 putative transcriptional regulator [Pseudohaliea rubra DSM 19751]